MHAPSPAPRRSWLRAAAWLAGGLLLLMALAWAGIGPLARWQIESRGSEKLGRAVTVAQVRFTPWNLRTALQGLEVAGLPGAQAPLLRVDKASFRIALSSLWQGAPVVEDLDIQAPQVRLARLSAGHYDIDDVIARLSTPAEPDRPPARYVLRNLRLAEGAIDFDDRALSGPTALHTVRELQLGLPAISSLAADRHGEVAPTLAFTLDGSRFDSSAEALPFAELRKGEAALHVAGLDLARLQGYWPVGLPLRPHAGVVDAQLKLAFAQNASPADPLFEIGGTVLFKGLSLQAADGREALSAESIRLQIAQVAPLQRSVKLERVEIVRPHLQIARDAAGRIDLAPAPAASAAPDTAAAPWKLELAQLTLRQGRIDWRDASPGEPVQMGLDALEVDASAIAWPMRQPAKLRGSAELASDAGRSRLEWSGTASPQSGRVALRAQSLPLALAQPYLQNRFRPVLGGRLGIDGAVAWSPAGITVEAASVAVDDLALARGGSTLAGAKRLAMQDIRLDTAQRTVSVARLDLAAPVGQLSRDAKGAWMFADWWAAAPGQPQAAAARAEAPWKVALKTLQVERGQFGWRDAVPRRPVALDLRALRLQASDLVWPLPAGARGLAVQFDTSVVAGNAAPASLKFKGTVAPDPLAIDGRLDASGLPLQAVEPYFGDTLNVQIVRADMGFAGTVRAALAPDGLGLQAVGDITVDNGRVDSATPDAPAAAPAVPVARTGGVLTPGARRATSLFSWKTLQARNATLRIAPGKPLFWGVHEMTLGDFFARLAINERGRLNLRELTRAPPGVPAAAQAGAGAIGPPELHFGQTHLVNGRVQFTDNFVKPSYSASLSELQGVLGAFDSVGAVYAEPAMAALELRGKAEGSAALDIRGKLNPLANPLAIDLVAKVDDLDLPALSPYSVKYMGYGIQRGKLSVDVHYRIEPDGKLLASNSLVLRQLVFDEQADGAPSSLPVRLAAALLADSNGVIDLDLPISGSLNDPQFSLAPVIGKALVNLVLRAVTSPFSLISSAFGRSSATSDSSTVIFAPGSAELTPAAQQDLDAVAKALAARPAVQVTVTGQASEKAETEGYRRERLRQLTRFEKRRALLAAAPAASAPPASRITVSAAEYPGLLKRVYAATDMPKPRNLLGMAKDLPQDEMERLLAAQVDVTDEALRGLALQRGVAVRDYLGAHGVPADRVFLGAVRMDESGAADWQPQVALRLSAR